MNLSKYIKQEEMLNLFIKEKTNFDWKNFIINEEPSFELLEKYLKHLNIKDNNFINNYLEDILKSNNPLINSETYLNYLLLNINKIPYSFLEKYKNKLDIEKIKNNENLIIYIDSKENYEKFLLFLNDNENFLLNYLKYIIINKKILEFIYLSKTFKKTFLLNIIFLSQEIYKEQETLFILFDNNILSVEDIDFEYVDNIIVFFFFFSSSFDKYKKKALKRKKANKLVIKYLVNGLNKKNIWEDYYYKNIQKKINLNNIEDINNIYIRIEAEIGKIL